MLGFDVGSNPSATQLDGRTPPPCSACIEQNLACQAVFWGQTVPGMATICHFDAIDAVGFMRQGAGGGGVLGSSFPAAGVVLLLLLVEEKYESKVQWWESVGVSATLTTSEWCVRN